MIVSAMKSPDKFSNLRIEENLHLDGILLHHLSQLMLRAKEDPIAIYRHALLEVLQCSVGCHRKGIQNTSEVAVLRQRERCLHQILDITHAA
jgi:hypothetical protein